MKTIMLCLNQLGIGGIETAVLSQATQLVKNGYNVIVIAKDGIYKEKFQNIGVKCIDFEFTIQNEFDKIKINKICEIIKKYSVEQVNIHQIDCIGVAFPACIFCDVPYVAYIHSGIKGTYDWFEKTYLSYNILFNLYFKMAEKIIAITEDSKNENKIKYNIDDSKYLIMKNCVDFEIFNNNKISENKEKFLLISRLSSEKMESIKNAILLFKEYSQKHPHAVLKIAGDGIEKNNVKKLVENNNKIIMLGQINNVAELMDESDIIIGIGRCILEAVAMKKIAILSSYNGLKGILTPDKIEKIANTNFVARDFDNFNTKDIINQIEKMSNEDIIDIVNKNYNYAYKNLNSSNSIYLINNNDGRKESLCLKETLNALIDLQNIYVRTNNQIHENYIKNEEAKEWLNNQAKIREQEFEKQIANLLNKNQELNEKLKTIYKSK